MIGACDGAFEEKGGLRRHLWGFEDRGGHGVGDVLVSGKKCYGSDVPNPSSMLSQVESCLTSELCIPAMLDLNPDYSRSLYITCV